VWVLPALPPARRPAFVVLTRIRGSMSAASQASALAPWAGPLAIALSYLVGSLSFAVIVSRLMGLADPRSYGSGNKAAALLTLAFDALKGYLPVMAALLWQERLGLGPFVIAMVGLAAFLGHLWPVFFRFQGGKGVATAAGVLLALNPVLGAATLASWLLIAVFFRYSSLASLVAAAFAPFFQLLIWGVKPVLLCIVPMSLLLVWRHGPNIRKLLAGTESKIGHKAGRKT